MDPDAIVKIADIADETPQDKTKDKRSLLNTKAAARRVTIKDNPIVDPEMKQYIDRNEQLLKEQESRKDRHVVEQSDTKDLIEAPQIEIVNPLISSSNSKGQCEIVEVQ